MERRTESLEKYQDRMNKLMLDGNRVKEHRAIYGMSEKEKLAHLTLSVPTKIKDQYPTLTKWEKLFVTNFYEGKPRPAGANRVAEVKNAIEKEYKRLCSLTEKDFKISTENNPELDRHFQGELKALRAQGEGDLATYYEANEIKAKKEMTEKLSETLYAEYKHIVDFIGSTTFEPAFKTLMLRETTLKTYKKIKENGDEKTIVSKRDMHKSISSHMTLNQDVLNTIYNELDTYSNFANLYFAGLAISNKTITENSSVKISGLNTFGKGKWIKFEGKQSNKEKYLSNAQKLSALVQDTPWCTKSLASSQLEEGDFFVFVDNDNKPHIAVKMNGNTVDEVRGIQNDNAQELEADYREVAIEFLTKNPEVKDGEKWLAKEEWNNRLIVYKKTIDEGKFSEKDVEGLIVDIFNTKADYKTHGVSANSNLIALKKSLKNISPILEKYFNCKAEEISYKDEYIFNQEKQPFVAIFGDAKFDGGRTAKLNKLHIVSGNVRFYPSSKVKSLSGLTTIGGDAYFVSSDIEDLGKLTTIGGCAWFEDSKVADLGNLTTIGGNADFRLSAITNLGNLTSIGGKLDLRNSKVKNLGKLEYVGGEVLVDEYTPGSILKNLNKGKDGKYRFKPEKVNEVEAEI